MPDHTTPYSMQLMQDVDVYIKGFVVLKSRFPEFTPEQTLTLDEIQRATSNYEVIVETDTYLDFYNFNGSMFKKDVRHV